MYEKSTLARINTLVVHINMDIRLIRRSAMWLRDTIYSSMCNRFKGRNGKEETPIGDVLTRSRSEIRLRIAIIRSTRLEKKIKQDQTLVSKE